MWVAGSLSPLVVSQRLFRSSASSCRPSSGPLVPRARRRAVDGELVPLHDVHSFRAARSASPCPGRCAASGRSLGAWALLAQQRAPAGGRGRSASLRAPLRVPRVPPRRWMPLVEESARHVSVVVRRAPPFPPPLCVRERRCVGPPPAPHVFSWRRRKTSTQRYPPNALRRAFGARRALWTSLSVVACR